MKLKQQVLEYLLTIPKGKVTTYKNIAIIFDTHPRAIASIMRSNKEPNKYPCYKVISASRKIGGYNTERGIEEKIERLRNDGIFMENGKIPEKHIV